MMGLHSRGASRGRAISIIGVLLAFGLPGCPPPTPLPPPQDADATSPPDAAVADVDVVDVAPAPAPDSSPIVVADTAPIPSSDAPLSVCGVSCRRLAAIPCREGTNPACVATCEHLTRAGLTPYDAVCIGQASTAAAVRKCVGGICTAP